MTKPIFEPTPQRQVSALRYDKNQLQRRPADPSGGLPRCWTQDDECPSNVSSHGVEEDGTGSLDLGTGGLVAGQGFFYLDLYTQGDFTTEQSAQVGGDLNVDGDASVGGQFSVSGQTVFDDAVFSLPNLPTADPGIPGRLWNDAGTLKVSL